MLISAEGRGDALSPHDLRRVSCPKSPALRHLSATSDALPRCRLEVRERRVAIAETLRKMLTHEVHPCTTNQGGFRRLPTFALDEYPST